MLNLFDSLCWFLFLSYLSTFIWFHYAILASKYLVTCNMCTCSQSRRPYWYCKIIIIINFHIKIQNQNQFLDNSGVTSSSFISSTYDIVFACADWSEHVAGWGHNCSMLLCTLWLLWTIHDLDVLFEINLFALIHIMQNSCKF